MAKIQLISQTGTHPSWTCHGCYSTSESEHFNAQYKGFNQVKIAPISVCDQKPKAQSETVRAKWIDSIT